jgi:multiple sugar transport system permease protein
MKHSALHALVIGCLWASFCHLLALTVSGLGLGQLIQMPAWPVFLLGGILGLIALSPAPYKAIGIVLITGFAGLGLSKSPAYALQLALYLGLGIYWIGCTTRWGINNRYRLELLWIRGLKLFGILALLVAVLFPLAVMVITSLKSQAQLLQNPLDLSVDWRNPDLFKSYITLIQEFGFATYFWNSLWVSAVTVVITLSISIPGAYAVARLRFPGASFFSQSILLIYMVPAIVLMLPLYVAFSQAGLRNTLGGLLLVYPATTIPVALYMLQGYFKGIPKELEEAGRVDGLSLPGILIKITLPLSLPALASVSLYVFMIAWNEFLFAFMFLDDPEIFTLPRGVASLNSSELPRELLMAGAVMTTLPVMALFLWLERFMVQGLTAGSVKG